MSSPSSSLGPVVIVAGSGPSLRAIDYARVDLAWPILRVNNFFFEPVFHLGRRVDLVHVGGDPRILPFYLRTLKRAGEDYRLGCWTSHRPRIAARFARGLPALQERPFRVRDAAVGAIVDAAIRRYQRQPTTGIYALLNAHGHGASEIRMAGLDFYGEPERYGFVPGRHMRDLLGTDIGARGYDLHLHSPDLDHMILDYLQSRDDLRLYRIADTPALADRLDLAPSCVGGDPGFVPPPRTRPTRDWEERAGLYPIGLLKLMRRLASWAAGRQRL